MELFFPLIATKQKSHGNQTIPRRRWVEQPTLDLLVPVALYGQPPKRHQGKVFDSIDPTQLNESRKIWRQCYSLTGYFLVWNGCYIFDMYIQSNYQSDWYKKHKTTTRSFGSKCTNHVVSTMAPQAETVIGSYCLNFINAVIFYYFFRLIVLFARVCQAFCLRLVVENFSSGAPMRVSRAVIHKLIRGLF